MKNATLGLALFVLAFVLPACAPRQPPGGDLWRIPSYQR